MARPKKIIDPVLVQKLAKVGCSNESIAIQCDCSVDTLTRRFADLLSKSREEMKTSLRIWQIEAARKGNSTMLVWLGKQMLHQKDQSEIKMDATVETTELTKEEKKQNQERLEELMRIGRELEDR